MDTKGEDQCSGPSNNPPQPPKEIYESYEGVVRRIALRSKKARLAHRFAAKSLKRLHFTLGGSATFLSSIAGLSSAASAQESVAILVPFDMSIAIGFTAMLAAALTALATFLRLDEECQAHHTADIQFSSVLGESELVLARLTSGHIAETKAASVVDSVNSAYSDAHRFAPIVDERHWRRSRRSLGIR